MRVEHGGNGLPFRGELVASSGAARERSAALAGGLRPVDLLLTPQGGPFLLGH
jgi:hypothetical protein